SLVTRPGNPRPTYWEAREASYPNYGRWIKIMIPGEPVSGASYPIGDFRGSGPPIALVTLVDDRLKDPANTSYTATWCSGAGVSGMSSGGTLLIESVSGNH